MRDASGGAQATDRTVNLNYGNILNSKYKLFYCKFIDNDDIRNIPPVHI